MDPGDGTSPHHRFSQRGYKSSTKPVTFPTLAGIKFNNNNNNVVSGNDEKKAGRNFNDILVKIQFNRPIPSAYSFRNLHTVSSLQEYLKYQDNPEWENVESVIIRLYQRKPLAVWQLNSLREIVRELWSVSRVGPLLFDYYLKQAFSNGSAEIRNKLTNLKDADLLKTIVENWNYFYSETLPTLQAIFFPMKPKQASLRHTVLISFRDEVILKLNLREALQSLSTLPPDGIKHMLLILQSIHDSYPPNENYLALERLVAMVVSPYMGYRGIYHGNPDPVLRSKEPEINRWSLKRNRPSSIVRLSMTNPNRAMDTLEEMFHNAYTKENDSE